MAAGEPSPSRPGCVRMVRSLTGPGSLNPKPMHRVLRAVAITVLVTVPAHQAREFEAAYWNRLFSYRSATTPAPAGWPGDPTMESLKETIVGSLPFPASLGTMDQYARRGIVPLLELRGEYAPVCFVFCIWFPKCVVVFVPTAEGYGIREIGRAH